MRNEQDRLARRDLLLHFDTILASCEYLLDDFYPGVRARKETAWVPHSASPDFVMTCAEAPQNAILLSAAVTAHYPLRQRMKTLFQEKRFPIVYHEHPGYHCNFDYESSNDIGKAYAQMINSCRASFVDSSVFGYVVAKYFEIPAAGSVLLADDAVWKPLEQLGFQAGVHYIGVSSRDLEDAIQYVLHAANWPILDEMRRRAQQLVLTRHTTSDRARLIDQVCRPV
ncbi:MAG TPA: glycosyltransferase [Bryobacteraceae bacterium]|nr:glycosyltransferase [Bryobacteraceae bacterium]